MQSFHASAVHSIQHNNTLHSPRRARTAASSNIPMFPTTYLRAIIAPHTSLHMELDCNTCVASLALDPKTPVDPPRGRRSSTVTKRLFQYSHQRGRRTEILSDCRVEIKKRRLQSFHAQRCPLYPAQQHATQSKTSKNGC